MLQGRIWLSLEESTLEANRMVKENFCVTLGKGVVNAILQFESLRRMGTHWCMQKVNV